jgi:hypothetical protein
VNDILAGASVFVAPTAEGLEIFGVEVDQSSISDSLVYGEAHTFVLNGTFSQGLAILPPFLFQGATAEFDLAVEETETEYDEFEDVYRVDVNTMDIDAEIVVTTDGDKIEVLGKDYKGAHLATTVVVESTYDETYPNNPLDNESSEFTVTADGEIFIAEKLGLAFISMEWDWGDAEDNEGMPHILSLDLTDTTVDD